MQSQGLAATFAALGDPVRQAVVDRLADGDATVNELASMFPVSLQAVSKHIKVLEAAGVVSRRREGKTRPVHLEGGLPRPLGRLARRPPASSRSAVLAAWTTSSRR